VRWLLTLALLGVAGMGTPALRGWAEEPARVTLPNDFRLITRADPGTDIAAIDLLLDLSVLDEPPAKSGIRYLVQRLLMRGTVHETGGKMAQQLASVGGAADISVGLDYVEIYALVPADGFELALNLMADAVRNPTFSADEVAKQKDQAKEAARSALEDPFQATYLALREELYQTHPYARSVFGEESSLEAITREDIRSFHEAYYRPSRAVVAVCGGVAPTRALRAIRAAFGDWADRPAPPRPEIPVPPLASSSAVARELPTERAHLIFGFPAPAAGEAGYYEMQVLQSLISGGATSRLPRALREDLGLAYEVSSFYPTLAGPSHVGIYVVTEPFAMEGAKAAVLEALNKLAQQPIAPPAAASATAADAGDELAKAKRYLLGSYALAHQRMKDQAYALAWYEILGPTAGPDGGGGVGAPSSGRPEQANPAVRPGGLSDARYAAGVEAVTPAGVQAAAASLLRSFVLSVTMPADL